MILGPQASMEAVAADLTTANVGHETALFDREIAQRPLKRELVSDRFLSLISHDFARQHLILSQGPCGLDDARREVLAIGNLTKPAALFNVGVRLGVPVTTFIADGELIAQMIDKVYGRAVESSNGSVECGADSASQANDQVNELLAQADRDLLSTEGKGPIIKLFDALLFEALSRLASDVHIQPQNDRTLVR